MSSNDSKPIHLLSEDAKAQGRNVFIWCGKTQKIMLSWRADLGLTEASMYRWMDIAIKESGFKPPESFKYTIFPATVEPEKRVLLTYRTCPTQNAKALCRTSNDVIGPGDYGIFREDGKRFSDTFRFEKRVNLLGQNQHLVKEYPYLVDKPSSKTEQDALKRDGHHCMFTGVSLKDIPESEAMWFLPLWGEYLASTVVPFDDLKPDYRERFEKQKRVLKGPNTHLKTLQTVDNCLVTTKEVSKLLWQNKVAVDVEDGYKVIYFEERGPDTPPFKVKLTRSNGLKDEYLRAHFRHSLAVNIIGGGIDDDFEEDALIQFVEDRGGLTNVYEESQFSGEDWGKEIGLLVSGWVTAERVNDGLRADRAMNR